MEEVVEYLIQELKDSDVVLQYYKSVTTTSHYIKMDFGVLNTIRISDHDGKRQLNYRYNLQSNIDSVKYKRETKRFYFPLEEVDSLIAQIKSDRSDRMGRYGRDNYIKYMRENVENNKDKKGFWKQAKQI